MPLMYTAVFGSPSTKSAMIFEAAFERRLLRIGQLRAEVDHVAVDRRIVRRLEHDGHQIHARVHRLSGHRDAGNQVLRQQLDRPAEIGARARG